jgi:hypothetical protein
MITSAIAARAIIDLIIFKQEFRQDFADFLLSSSDWIELKLMSEFLEVPAKISTFLGGDSKYCTISRAIVANVSLINHCKRFVLSDNPLLQLAASKILNYNEEYAGFINSLPARVAQFVDPRIRIPALDSADFSNTKAEISEVLATDYADNTESRPPEKSGGITISADDEFWEQAFELEVHETPSLPEVDRFAVLPAIDRKQNILHWWSTRQDEFPMLRRLAFDYLAIPASSVPAERANSAGGRAFDGRIRLHSATFKAELCCRSWLNLCRTMKVQLPRNFRDAFNSISTEDLAALEEQDEVVAYLLANRRSTSSDSDEP